MLAFIDSLAFVSAGRSGGSGKSVIPSFWERPDDRFRRVPFWFPLPETERLVRCEATPQGAKGRTRIVLGHLRVRIEHVAVGKVLNHMAPGISPVVKDLASQDMATDARMMFVTGLCQMIVTRHDSVNVFDLEGRMIEARLSNTHAEQSVMVCEFIASVTAHEGCNHVLGFTEIDLIRRQKTEPRLVPFFASSEIGHSYNRVPKSLDRRGARGRAMNFAKALAVAAAVDADRGRHLESR